MIKMITKGFGFFRKYQFGRTMAIYGVCLMPWLFSSCGNSKNAIYFKDVSSSSVLISNEDLEPIIQSNDLLSITVSSPSVEASEIFNITDETSSQVPTAMGGYSKFSGYLVDKDGFIRFPVLSRIEAEGKSKRDLREDIRQMLIERKLLLEPIVEIRYLNFKVSV